MKKIKLKQWLYIAGLLCMGVSCKKEECICGECGAPDQKMTYRTTVENAKADVGFGGLIIENIKGEQLICYQQKKLGDMELKQTYDYKTKEPQPFKYRVWGTVYNCDNCPTYIQGDALYFKIDKIEYQNKNSYQL